MHRKSIPFDVACIISIILLTLATLHYSSSAALVDEYYANCAPLNSICGLSQTLTYPFWDGSRPSYCGHPGFMVQCQSGSPTLQMKNETYNVLNISYKSNVFTVSKTQFSEGPCPNIESQLTNTTLDLALFNYTSSSQNVTLFYNCSKNQDGVAPYSFTCPQYAFLDPIPTVHMSSLNYLVVDDKWKDELRKQCAIEMYLPVLRTEVVTLETAGLTNMNDFASKGFELRWTIDESQCDDCLKSGGRCGFNQTLDQPVCFCHDGLYGSTCDVFEDLQGSKTKKWSKNLNVVLLACFSAIGMCVVLILLLYVRKKCSSDDSGLEVPRGRRKVDVEAFLKSHGSSGPKRYTYTDMKKITNCFNNKIGEGGYGYVYKGQLQNGKLVAVKMLHKSKGDAAEFINEVGSIGNTNHVNVVKLFGFCYEGNKRALVYEFMVNGSLEKFLSKGINNPPLGLGTLFEIAIGVARGLEYLHRGCNTRILHFDIKPHNILLDDKFCPKISDFGLSKSFPQKDSIMLSMSEARGTVGYIAPEVFFKRFGGVSHKSDVYSYGMLILEMIGFRRNANVGGISSEQSFPEWIYEQLERDEDLDQEGVLSSEEIEMQRKMMIVSLWCVKTNPSSRPAMSKVVEMLEGAIELQIPAASSLSASPRSPVTALDTY